MLISTINLSKIVHWQVTFLMDVPMVEVFVGCSQIQLENILKGEVPDLILPIDKVPTKQTNNSQLAK